MSHATPPLPHSPNPPTPPLPVPNSQPGAIGYAQTLTGRGVVVARSPGLLDVSVPPVHTARVVVSQVVVVAAAAMMLAVIAVVESNTATSVDLTYLINLTMFAVAVVALGGSAR